MTQEEAELQATLMADRIAEGLAGAIGEDDNAIIFLTGLGIYLGQILRRVHVHDPELVARWVAQLMRSIASRDTLQ